ncbi:MAG TPA: hypothetical protein DEA08_32485 [Planctomycetes bacterium]|nr:hypothetical protein [Planctomycetota bacterium]
MLEEHKRYRQVWSRRPGDAAKSSPAFMIAGFLHLALLVALSFWTIAVHLERDYQPVDVTLRKQKTVTVTAGTQQEQAALNALADATKRDLEMLNESATDDPFHEARGDASGQVNVFGAGGGGRSGVGRGGRKNNRGGSSKASEGAVTTGLEWLSRHRNDQGVWTQIGAGHQHVEGWCEPKRRWQTKRGDVARTGMALLGFLLAGHSPSEPGRYQALVKKAEEWLVGQVGRDGRFQGGFNGYVHSIGTLALSECLARHDDEELRQAVHRAVRCLLGHQSKRLGGWRYNGNGDSDTSVTSWGLLALKSAEAAGVSVPSGAFQGVRKWVARVSTPAGGTGYTGPSDGGAAMNATGLFLRVILGEKPTTPMNRKAAEKVARCQLALQGKGISNFYAIYYSALALYQVGGELWQEFNPRIRDALINTQRKGKHCERGSWEGGGFVSDPVLATCFATLTLETYYRYLPQHGRKASPGERALEEALGALDQAREAGELLALTAAFGRALELLTQEGADWDLRAEAQVGLARAHAKSGEYAQAKAALDLGLRLVPRGEQGPEGAQDLYRRLRLLEALSTLNERAQAAQALTAKESASAEEREESAGALRVSVTRVRFALARTPGLDEPTRQQVERSLANAEELASGLLMGGDRDQAIASGLARLATLEPGPHLEPFERRLVVLLVQRAHERFLAARAGRSFARYEEGARDRSALRRLDPLRRAEAHEQPRLRAALSQLDLSQIAALIALDQRADALKRLADLPLRYPDQRTALVQGQALERALLLSAPRRDPEQAQRLRELLLRARRLGEPLTPAERLTLAQLDLEARRPELAERGLEALLADPRVPPPLQRRAELRLSEVYRRQGRADEAWRLLEGMPLAERARLEVILERCQVLRARRRPREALDEYVGVLRAIEHEDPAAWWEVAEETARCYLEAREIRAARDFMEGLRLKDRTFGGDPERRERLLVLMRRADDARVRSRSAAPPEGE